MNADYLEAVMDLVAAIPAGRVMTYGTVAEVLHEQGGQGGPRQVGQIMARFGGDAPWWRVVNVSGEPPHAYREQALARLRSEGCPLTSADDAAARVALSRALWWPERT